MVKFTKDSIIDVEAYGEALNRLRYIYCDLEAAKMAVEYLKSRSETLAARATFTMQLHSGCRLFTLDKEAVYRYLTQIAGCSEHYFHTGKSQSFSLDIRRVLAPIYAKGKATEFLDDYMMHRSMKMKYGNLRKLVEVCDTPVATDNTGKELVRIPFEAGVQTNLRFNYRNVDIISQIPKSVADIICADDGYFLAWGDFEQSDFRIAYNLFMRSEENDRIMNQYDDKYEALARIISKRLSKPFDLEQFKEDRQLYKKLTLATVYGMRNCAVPEEAAFINMFSEFLMECCPRYKEYYCMLEDYSSLGVPLELTSYFGYKQYVVGDKRSHNKLQYDALNMPVQTGTSEIVILTVNSILQKARECGLTEDEFGLYMTRHDEPIFRIKEDKMDYLWILQEHSKVLVDDWSPLAMKFDYGYHYKQVDEELERKAEEVYRCHPSTRIEQEVYKGEPYYPIKPLLSLSFHEIAVECCGVTIVAIQNDKTGEALFSIYETLDEEEVIKEIRRRIMQCSEVIEAQYGGVCVRSNFYSGEDFFGQGLRVIYQREVSANMNKVVQLCKSMTFMYCQKNGVEAPEGCNSALERYPETLKLLIPEVKDNG